LKNLVCWKALAHLQQKEVLARRPAEWLGKYQKAHGQGQPAGKKHFNFRKGMNKFPQQSELEKLSNCWMERKLLIKIGPGLTQ